MEFRLESDTMGIVQVLADRYWGGIAVSWSTKCRFPCASRYENTSASAGDADARHNQTSKLRATMAASLSRAANITRPRVAVEPLPVGAGSSNFKRFFERGHFRPSATESIPSCSTA